MSQTGDTPAKKTKKAKKTSKVQRAEKKVEKAKQKKKAARLEGHLVLNSSINTPATLNAGVRILVFSLELLLTCWIVLRI